MTKLEVLARLVRYFILISTTEAGSGHPTSSLSATDIMVALFFGGFYRFDFACPEYPNNDRLIFSKGHASPLLYALYAVAGAIPAEELLTLRKFGSRLEGHPSMAFPYTEAATGSLGQGLSIGVGMALNAKYIDKLPYCTFVLLGDSEMSEGAVWEAIQLAAHYKLDNLVGILDTNRLGQRGETMYGHDTEAYRSRVSAFGWDAVVIDGHNFEEIAAAFVWATGRSSIFNFRASRQFPISKSPKPKLIVAKTIKGKGVSFIEDKDGCHGKAFSREELARALEELGEIDKEARGEIAKPAVTTLSTLDLQSSIIKPHYDSQKQVATRRAYGNALVRIFPKYPNIVVLDAEVSNSTYAEIFKDAHPERYFEMYVAEQNMVGAAVGLSRRGKIPFVSSFAAFLTRAFDQIRMSQYSEVSIKFVGSHAGVSIGEDGPSQMGLEDLAMFRTLLGSVVLYPSDAISTEKLVEEAAAHRGIVYIRTTRKETPILYPPDETFPIGGSKVLRRSGEDAVTVVAAGITLHEALAAHEALAKEGISIRVIDLYSVKPVDQKTLQEAARETKAIITVEDHFAEGGIGDAVREAFSPILSFCGSLSRDGADSAEESRSGQVAIPIYSLAVRTMPKSGKPEELLRYEGISSEAIVRKVRETVGVKQ